MGLPRAYEDGPFRRRLRVGLGCIPVYGEAVFQVGRKGPSHYGEIAAPGIVGTRELGGNFARWDDVSAVPDRSPEKLNKWGFAFLRNGPWCH